MILIISIIIVVVIIIIIVMNYDITVMISDHHSHHHDPDYLATLGKIGFATIVDVSSIIISNSHIIVSINSISVEFQDLVQFGNLPMGYLVSICPAGGGARRGRR